MIIAATLALAASTAFGQIIANPPVAPSPPPMIKAEVEVDDLNTLTIDELIHTMPKVGLEGRYDPAVHKWVYAPEVEQMKRRLAEGAKLDQKQWQRALTKTGIITCRPVWPKGHTIIVSMQDSYWLPNTEIRLKPRHEALNAVTGGQLVPDTCGNAMMMMRDIHMNQKLGQLPVGKHHIVFDTEIERGEAWFSGPIGPKGIVWKGEITLDLEIVPTLAEAVPPLNTAAATAAIRDGVGFAAVPWGKDSKPVGIIVFDLDVPSYPELATTAISAKAQLLRDGEVKRSFPLAVTRRDDLLNANSVYAGPVQLFTFVTVDDIPSDKLTDPAELARWSLRVEGTEDNVLKFWHASKRWDGKFEVTLADALKNEQKRTAGKPPRSYIWMP